MTRSPTVVPAESPLPKFTVSTCPETLAVNVPVILAALEAELAPTPVRTNPDGKVTWISPLTGIAFVFVKPIVTLPVTLTEELAGVTLGLVKLPAVIVTAATDVFSSIFVLLVSVVLIWKVPDKPEIVGFVILLKTKLFALDADCVPPLRVNVTIWPETEALKLPSRFVKLLAAVLPMLNPEGNVTTILPSKGIALDVVNETVAFPSAPATNETGVTLVDERAPAVMVIAGTEVS